MTVSNVATPPSGAAAAYAFNDGTGTTAADASGHSLTGTLVNGPTWAAGKYGSAVSFDGVDDFVDLGNPAALQITGSMTISGWINSAAFPADDAAVVSKRASTRLPARHDDRHRDHVPSGSSSRTARAPT